MPTNAENRQMFASDLPAFKGQQTGWYWYESFEGISEESDPLACVVFWDGTGGIEFEFRSQDIASNIQTLAARHHGSVIRNVITSPKDTFPLRGMTILFTDSD